MADTKPTIESKEFTSAKGELLVIHAVPQLALAGVKLNRPKPVRPQLEMPIKGGGVQKRWAKSGDPEYDEWEEAKAEWEAEKDKLEESITKVMALRTYEVAPGLTLIKATKDQLPLPEHIQLLIDTEVLELPDNVWTYKRLWLDSTVLSQQDDIEMTWILQELAGVPEEVIESMKAQFRRSIFGASLERLGSSDGANATAEEGDES